MSDLEDGDYFAAAVVRHRQPGWAEKVELGDVLNYSALASRSWEVTRELLVQRLRDSSWLSELPADDRRLVAVQAIQDAASMADAESAWALLVTQADEDRVWLETLAEPRTGRIVRR